MKSKSIYLIKYENRLYHKIFYFFLKKKKKTILIAKSTHYCLVSHLRENYHFIP
jgi:hypothetical protein